MAATSLLFATLLIGTATPAQDVQASMDYTIATGQAAVLDSMNREATKKMHRDAGLPPPDFEAARRRVTASRSARRGRMSASERASKCRTIRANLHRLTASQMAIYRKGCT